MREEWIGISVAPSPLCRPNAAVVPRVGLEPLPQDAPVGLVGPRAPYVAVLPVPASPLSGPLALSQGALAAPPSPYLHQCRA